MQKDKRENNAEDNIGSKSEIGPVGYIYLYNKDKFPTNAAKYLGTGYDGHTFVTLPLLKGFTVEHGFNLTTKAIHKKIDSTTVFVRPTCYHPEVFIFHNAQCIPPVFEGPGLSTICTAARSLFGYSLFNPISDKNSFKINDYVPTGFDANEYIGAAVITEAFKERLYFGNLIIFPCLFETVDLHNSSTIRIPLFDKELYNNEKVKYFYSSNLSKGMFECLFTGIAQALRIKNVECVIQAMEKQSLQDHVKMSKLVDYKQFNDNVVKNKDSAVIMTIDAAATELSASYGLSFIESIHEDSGIMDYKNWPIISDAENESDKIEALQKFNASLAPHIAAQLFSANSIYYISGIGKNTSSTNSGYNLFYISNGLATIQLPAWDEQMQQVFPGFISTDGANYTIDHWAYAAAFSPNIMARQAYYLQFCQGQKSFQSQQNLAAYISTAANSSICYTCNGKNPAVCIHTLFYRLKDRFPPVTACTKKEPYIISGATGTYNDVDILGNFAGFKEKDEDSKLQNEEDMKWTYWQLNQSLTEKLSQIGINEQFPDSIKITSIADFINTFKDIDAIVENEAGQFVNNMMKNNINYKETIKNIYHIIQYSCNQYAQVPCPVFRQLFYKSILTIIQDISLPLCMAYETENTSMGVRPSEWLKIHYQTLWTNFKNQTLDKGLLTATEYKVIHNDPTYDIFDPHQAANGIVMPMRVQVRISKSLILCPKNIKIKNRILFSGENAALAPSFTKSSVKKDNYIINGPFMIFLNKYHKVIFPDSKCAALYVWGKFSRQKQLPVTPTTSTKELIELANFVDLNSRLHEEFNVIDIIPDTFLMYAKQKFNNLILKACGQHQFYITLIHALTPVVNYIPASEYPHVLGKCEIKSIEDYQEKVNNKKALSVNCVCNESVSTICKQRPVITLPVLVNKYTGINGNAQIFQAGNLGYFIGKGVDRNLLSGNINSFKRNQSSSFLRKKFVFLTPLLGNILKKYEANVVIYEIETIKAAVQNVLEKRPTEDNTKEIVLVLIKFLGSKVLTLDVVDVNYFLGQYNFLGNQIMETFKKLQACISEDWSTDVVREALTNILDDSDDAFIDIGEQILGQTETIFSLPNQTPPKAKKRPFHTILNDIDF